MKDFIIWLADFLKTEDISSIKEEKLSDIAITAITGKPFEQALLIGKAIYDLPTRIFWYKMSRYLKGAFLDYEIRVKLASKFNTDNEEYIRYVEDLVYTINQIDNSDKIDWFASLTRAFLLTEMERDLFFKLSKYLLICTYYELKFIKNCPYDFSSVNTAMISALFQYGLFAQNDDAKVGIRYVLSDFAIALKQHCLNFDEGLNNRPRIMSYNELNPLNLPEAATVDEVQKKLYI